jgi:nucleotide-binding universal stress UspA family protein
VVGIDGSPGSHEALRFALAEARLRGARLKLVSAWSYALLASPVGMMAPIDDELIADLRTGAEALVDRALAEVGGPGADQEIEKVVAEGAAAHVLLEAAQGADLLVVGTRGHGGFAGLLLGSVSHQLTHHAPCPVVVVPAAAG